MKTLNGSPYARVFALTAESHGFYPETAQTGGRKDAASQDLFFACLAFCFLLFAAIADAVLQGKS